MARNVGDASKRFDQLEKTISDLGKSMRNVTKRLDGLEKGFQGAAKGAKKMDQAVSGGATGVSHLRNQLDKNKKTVDDNTASFGKFQRVLSIARSRMLIVAFAGRMVAKTLGRMFMAAAEQQQAEIKLSSALGRTSKALLDHASAMQQNTRFGDESVIAAQASIAAFIKDEEVIKSLTEATADLAAAKGMDLTAAADMVAKSVGSSTNALSRYGIAAFGAAKSTERAESVVKNITTLYGGQAKAQAESYAGTIDGMKNALGDAAEAIGDLLAPIVIVLAEGLKTAANMIERFIDGLNSASVATNNFFFGLTNLKEATIDTAKATSEYAKKLEKMSAQEVLDKIKLLEEMLGKNKKTTNEAIIEVDNLTKHYIAQADATNVVLETGGKIIEVTKAIANANKIQVETQDNLALSQARFLRLQNLAQELYAKTTTSQKAATQSMIKWVEANEAAFESTEAYEAVLAMLESQMDSLTKKEDVLTQKRIMGIGLVTSAFSNMVSAQKTEIESRMNAELTALRETTSFQRMSSERRVVEEKKITDKFKSERKANWENEKSAKIAQATLNAYQAVSKAWGVGGPFGAALATFVGLMAFKQVASMHAVQAPKFALGGDFITSGPQNIMVGDNPGGRERVQVTPLSSPNIDGPQGGGGSITVNVSGNVMSQDYVEGELAEQIKEAIRRGNDFGLT